MDDENYPNPEERMLDEIVYALGYHYEVKRVNPHTAQVTDFRGNILVINVKNTGKQ